MNFVTDFGIECVKYGNGGTGAIPVAILVVSTGKLELEVEETFGVALGVPEIGCLGEGAEGTVQLMVGDPVVVTGVGV